ncbi:FAD-dependent oxidoreductase [Ningiella sp. W23]|uniref:FAD-dependent oxidoreductase n=1 Tax=Ningiella sp. W23 TaxID=3023715 RepID=UPI0037571658
MKKCFLFFLVLTMNEVQANETLRAAIPSAEVIINDSDYYQHIVGSRPGRKNSFRLELEQINGQTVVHNYGHGGYGVTLSPGTAITSIQLAKNKLVSAPKIVVIGAGINGATIAYMLAKEGYKVEIVSKDYYPKNVSGVAAALWNPYTLEAESETRSQLLFQVQNDSLNYFINLMPDDSWGIRPVDVFVPTNDAVVSEIPFFLPFEQTPIKWHRTLPISGFKISGYQASTYFIDTSIYMPKLMKELNNAGVLITQMEIQSLGDYTKTLEAGSVVFNATGLGAKWLVPDTSVEPIRGDLCIFDNQDIRSELSNDYILMWGERPDYLFTRVSNKKQTGQYILGGVYEYGDASTEIKPHFCERTIKSYHAFIEQATGESDSDEP